MKLFKPTKSDQRGSISLIITLTMMLVLSLVVIAFFRISQRNQRQVLDRQLHTQAFYAAESGINDARDAIRRAQAGEAGFGNLLTTGTTNCGDLETTYGYPRTISNVISYSCLLIDPTPSTLEYGSIGSGESKVIPYERQDGQPISSIQIFWLSPGGDDPINNPNFDQCPAGMVNGFPPKWSDRCDPGILRVDVVPQPVGVIKRSDLIDGTATAYFVPQQQSPNTAARSGGSVTYTSAKGIGVEGPIISTKCSKVTDAANPRHCKAEITGINSRKIYLRLMALYKSATVTICSPNCSNPVDIRGAQVQIDSTGRANDVLQRLQVRVNLAGEDFNGPFPNFGIESGSTICKQLTIIPPGVVNFGGDPACGRNGGVLGAVGGLPPPTPPPTSTDPTASAAVTPCQDLPKDDPMYCPTTGSILHTYYRWFYTGWLVNRSVPPDGTTVIGCQWDWETGTSYSDNHDIKTNTACNYNQGVGYCYLNATPYPPYSPSSRKGYTVTLNEYYSNGTTGVTTYGQNTPYRTNYWNDSNTGSLACSIVEPTGYTP